jgi:hypothetical protein
MESEGMDVLQFIGEAIEVEFDRAPKLEKDPTCPNRFIWRDQTYAIVELLGEWRDYGRRDRMTSNMRPEHAATAAQRGSWGVGRIFFRVLTDSTQLFDLYYDRAPKNVRERKGGWYLFRELRPDAVGRDHM